jgi:hypothetical protein
VLFLYWGTLLFQLSLGIVYLRRWLNFGQRGDLLISLLGILSFIFLLLIGSMGIFTRGSVDPAWIQGLGVRNP